MVVLSRIHFAINMLYAVRGVSGMSIAKGRSESTDNDLLIPRTFKPVTTSQGVIAKRKCI